MGFLRHGNGPIYGTKCAIAVLFSAFIATAVVADIGGLSNLENKQLFVVVSDSMDGGGTDFEIGTIPEGSVVTVERRPVDEIKVGDVVAFNSGETVIVHRVILIDDDCGTMLTKGDANVTYEEIATGDIIGVVTHVSVFISGVMKLVMNAYSQAVMIVVCLLSIASVVRRGDRAV